MPLHSRLYWVMYQCQITPLYVLASQACIAWHKANISFGLFVSCMPVYCIYHMCCIRQLRRPSFYTSVHCILFSAGRSPVLSHIKHSVLIHAARQSMSCCTQQPHYSDCVTASENRQQSCLCDCQDFICQVSCTSMSHPVYLARLSVTRFYSHVLVCPLRI